MGSCTLQHSSVFVFSVTMPTQKAAPKKAATEVAESTHTYRDHASSMGWIRQVPRGAQNEVDQLWDKFACCFAWKEVLFEKGGNLEGAGPKGHVCKLVAEL